MLFTIQRGVANERQNQDDSVWPVGTFYQQVTLYQLGSRTITSVEHDA